MQQISFYLKKFENFGLKENFVKTAVIESVFEIAKVELKKEEVEITNDRIKIKKSGPEKSEIFINKEKIEELIGEKLSNSKIQIGRKNIT